MYNNLSFLMLATMVTKSTKPINFVAGVYNRKNKHLMEYSHFYRKYFRSQLHMCVLVVCVL